MFPTMQSNHLDTNKRGGRANTGAEAVTDRESGELTQKRRQKKNQQISPNETSIRILPFQWEGLEVNAVDICHTIMIRIISNNTIAKFY